MISFQSIQLFLLRILVGFFLVCVSLINLYSQCDNSWQYPNYTIPIGTGITQIISSISAGQYCVTNNYIANSQYSIKASTSTFFLTLRKASDNSIITYGNTPVKFIYQSSYGDLEIHVNVSNNNCGFEFSNTNLEAQLGCINENNYPNANQLISCGENLIADDVFAGDYFLTYGYVDGKESLFSSSNSNDYITLRKTNGEIINQGNTPLSIIYQPSYGDIMVHINKNQNCDTRDVPRSVTITKECICNNFNQYPDNTLTLSCGNNIISQLQYAGQFNLTTGYVTGKNYTFKSSIVSDQLTLRSNTDNALIAEGTSPLTITYYSYMGDIEMHVNQNEYCNYDYQYRTTSIDADCTCEAPTFSASGVFISCLDTAEYQSYAGEYKNSNGYQLGQSCTFTSSVATDYFILRNAIDNTFITSGKSPLNFVYNQNYNNIEIHLLSDSLCNIDNTLRLVEISGICNCLNQTNYPVGTTTLTCDTNLITVFQFASEYNLSTGYIHGRNVVFTSSIATDFITLRKENGKALIAEGITPLSILYDSMMGNIEMHINTNDMCGMDNNIRTTKIILECIDQDSDGFDDLIDNCPEDANPFQSDSDLDGIGDLCDVDEISINNVGIGTEEPSEKLHIKDGSLYIDKPFEGVIFKTLSGFCVKLSISEFGDFTSTPIDCPDSN